MAKHILNGKVTASKFSGEVNSYLINSIDYSKITLIGKKQILFVWLDELEDQYKTLSSGILLVEKLSSAKPRWARVIMSTDDSEVREGEYILPLSTIEQFGCNIGDIEHWRTTDDMIQLVTPDYEDIDRITDA